MFSGFIRPFPVPYCHSLAIIIGWLPTHDDNDIMKALRCCYYCTGTSTGGGGGDTELVCDNPTKSLFAIAISTAGWHSATSGGASVQGTKEEAPGNSDSLTTAGRMTPI